MCLKWSREDRLRFQVLLFLRTEKHFFRVRRVGVRPNHPVRRNNQEGLHNAIFRKAETGSRPYFQCDF